MINKKYLAVHKTKKMNGPETLTVISQDPDAGLLRCGTEKYTIENDTGVQSGEAKIGYINSLIELKKVCGWEVTEIS